MKRACTSYETTSNQVIYVIAVSKEERGTDRKKNFCNKNDEKFPNSVGSTQGERN